MRATVVLVMILGGATLTKADIIETISLDLSALNPGSTLSGSFALPDSPPYPGTAPVTLSFSDPSDYSPTSLTTTISTGVVYFGPVNFFDPAIFMETGYTGPEEIEVGTVGYGAAPAICYTFPCTSQGSFLIVGLTGAVPHTYAEFTITPTPVPEPRYALLVPLLFLGIIFGRSLLVRNE